MMKRALFTLSTAASFAASTSAHTVLSRLFVNGVSQGDGTCIRMPNDAGTATYPVEDIKSDDMACGIDGENPVNLTCPASAGGKLTFEFRAWPDASQTGSIEEGHKGPCAVYAKQVNSMSKDSATGPGWFKLWEEGYDPTTKQWCIDKFRENNGLLTIRIPEGLPSGYWLFRPELLALHDVPTTGPQFFTQCAQVFVDGNSSTPLNVPATQRVSIPGYLEEDDPGLTFNIYESGFPYPVPGPEVFEVPLAVAGVSLDDASLPQQTEGVIPSDYIVKNGNWVGFEVSSYTDEKGCDAAFDECEIQVGSCYDNTQPTGNAGCRAMETRCSIIQDTCGDRKPTGPPNGGRKLQVQEPAPPGEIPDPVNI
ncbi:lytic polysaccharide monooxygenase [Xylariaceae sp. FL1272]|nr:lytic polysaccharide monooxygenase [Xylariaceae sp. FL1272]